MTTYLVNDIRHYKRLFNDKKIEECHLKKLIEVVSTTSELKTKCQRCCSLWHWFGTSEIPYQDSVNSFQRLFKFTASLVLSTQWTKVDLIHRMVLLKALASVSQMFEFASRSCASLIANIYDPWISIDNFAHISDQCVQKFLETDVPELLDIRIERLFKEGHYHSALKFCERSLTQFSSLEKVLNPPSDGGGSQPTDLRPHVTFIAWKLILEYKGYGSTAPTQVASLLRNFSCYEGLWLSNTILERCSDAKKIASKVIELFLFKDIYSSTNYSQTLELIKKWCYIQNISGVKPLEASKNAETYLQFSTSSVHYYYFLQELYNQFGRPLLAFCFTFFVRGFSMDVNELEILRQETCSIKYVWLSRYMAISLISLAEILYDELYTTVALECALAAFSLEPSAKNMGCVKRLIEKCNSTNIIEKENCQCNGRCITPDKECTFSHPLLDAQIEGVSDNLLVDFTSLLENVRKKNLFPPYKWDSLGPVCQEMTKSYNETLKKLKQDFTIEEERNDNRGPKKFTTVKRYHNKKLATPKVLVIPPKIQVDILSPKCRELPNPLKRTDNRYSFNSSAKQIKRKSDTRLNILSPVVATEIPTCPMTKPLCDAEEPSNPNKRKRLSTDDESRSNDERGFFEEQSNLKMEDEQSLKNNEIDPSSNEKNSLQKREHENLILKRIFGSNLNNNAINDTECSNSKHDNQHFRIHNTRILEHVQKFEKVPSVIQVSNPNTGDIVDLHLAKHLMEEISKDPTGSVHIYQNRKDIRKNGKPRENVGETKIKTSQSTTALQTPIILPLRYDPNPISASNSSQSGIKKEEGSLATPSIKTLLQSSITARNPSLVNRDTNFKNIVQDLDLSKSSKPAEFEKNVGLTHKISEENMSNPSVGVIKSVAAESQKSLILHSSQRMVQESSISSSSVPLNLVVTENPPISSQQTISSLRVINTAPLPSFEKFKQELKTPRISFQNSTLSIPTSGSFQQLNSITPQTLKIKNSTTIRNTPYLAVKNVNPPSSPYQSSQKETLLHPSPNSNPEYNDSSNFPDNNESKPNSILNFNKKIPYRNVSQETERIIKQSLLSSRNPVINSSTSEKPFHSNNSDHDFQQTDPQIIPFKPNNPESSPSRSFRNSNVMEISSAKVKMEQQQIPISANSGTQQQSSTKVESSQIIPIRTFSQKDLLINMKQSTFYVGSIHKNQGEILRDKKQTYIIENPNSSNFPKISNQSQQMLVIRSKQDSSSTPMARQSTHSVNIQNDTNNLPKQIYANIIHKSDSSKIYSRVGQNLIVKTEQVQMHPKSVPISQTNQFYNQNQNVTSKSSPQFPLISTPNPSTISQQLYPNSTKSHSLFTQDYLKQIPHSSSNTNQDLASSQSTIEYNYNSSGTQSPLPRQQSSPIKASHLPLANTFEMKPDESQNKEQLAKSVKVPIGKDSKIANFVCEVCPNKTYVRHCSLKKHMQNVHNIEIPDIPTFKKKRKRPEISKFDAQTRQIDSNTKSETKDNSHTNTDPFISHPFEEQTMRIMASLNDLKQQSYRLKKPSTPSSQSMISTNDSNKSQFTLSMPQNLNSPSLFTSANSISIPISSFPSQQSLLANISPTITSQSGFTPVSSNEGSYNFSSQLPNEGLNYSNMSSSTMSADSFNASPITTAQDNEQSITHDVLDVHFGHDYSIASQWQSNKQMSQQNSGETYNLESSNMLLENDPVNPLDNSPFDCQPNPMDLESQRNDMLGP